MKKIKIMTGWIIIAFSLAFSVTVTGQISKTCSFRVADIERKTQKKWGTVYEQVKLKKTFQSRDVGKPSLPVYYYKFYVPKGKAVTGVTFKSTGSYEMQLDADLIPAQHSVLISQIGSDTAFDKPDEQVYGTDAFYPEMQANVVRSDFLDLDLEIVTVAVYPV